MTYSFIIFIHSLHIVHSLSIHICSSIHSLSHSVGGSVGPSVIRTSFSSCSCRQAGSRKSPCASVPCTRWGPVGNGEDRQEGCQSGSARAREGAWLPSGVWAAGHRGAGETDGPRAQLAKRPARMGPGPAELGSDRAGPRAEGGSTGTAPTPERCPLPGPTELLHCPTHPPVCAVSATCPPSNTSSTSWVVVHG